KRPVIQPASPFVRCHPAMNSGSKAGHVYAPIWAHTCATQTQVTRRAGLTAGRRSLPGSWCLQPLDEALLDLVADPPEDLEPLFLGALRPGGILVRPVQTIDQPGHERAVLVRVVADGDEMVPALLHEPGADSPRSSRFRRVDEQALHDHAVAPLPLELAVALVDPHHPEAALLVESEAGRVLGKDARQDLPEAALGIQLTERVQRGAAGAGAAGG